MLCSGDMMLGHQTFGELSVQNTRIIAGPVITGHVIGGSKSLDASTVDYKDQ